MDRLSLKHSFNHNGHRTAKMNLVKVDDTIKVWVSIGEKGCMIMLDKDNVEQLIGFLKENG